MHTLGEERDMFAGLGWKKKMKSLGDHHDPYTPSPEHDICVGNLCSDDYELTPFLLFTQV
jgi:hypothetical protein